MNAIKSLLFLIFTAGLGGIYLPLSVLTSGPRNPIYIGVILILIGHFAWLGRLTLILYIAIVFLALYLFVIGYEEQNLRRRFRAEYEEYCKQVQRWIPKYRK